MFFLLFFSLENVSAVNEGVPRCTAKQGDCLADVIFFFCLLICSSSSPWQDKDIKLTVEDNLYKWTAYLQGPEGTPFEGGCFQVLLDVQVCVSSRALEFTFHGCGVARDTEIRVSVDPFNAHWRSNLITISRSRIRCKHPRRASLPESSTQISISRRERSSIITK